MEGTVTISLKDYEHLRRCEETKDYVERMIKSVLDEYGEVSQTEATRIVDKLIDKMFI